jgi:hypothetical protein
LPHSAERRPGAARASNKKATKEREETMNHEHGGPGGKAITTVKTLNRRMHGTRALDYRKEGSSKRYQRCSRCHAEHEVATPAIYAHDGTRVEPDPTMAVLMVGQDLLGFICSRCFYSVSKAIVSLFPDEFGLPFVDEKGRLVPVSRCDTCGTPLRYSDDGRSVLCPQCDVPGE